MLKSFLSITLQDIRKNPGFSAVKILSLAIGLACGILVLMHLRYAHSYDRHFPNAENIYRLVSDFTSGGETVSAMVSAPAWETQLRLDYPQIINSANVLGGYARFSRGDVGSYSDFAWVDPSFIALFSLEFISGDPGSALVQPFSVVLTQTTAEKYFPGEDPMGQTLTFEERADFEVTGVIRDFPENTHFNLPMLVSVETGGNLGLASTNESNWYLLAGTVTYLSFAGKEEADAVNNDLQNFLDRHLPEPVNATFEISDLSISLEPIADAYLSERERFIGYNNRTKVFGFSDSPRKQILLGLGLFSLLILITSATNFASLSLAQIQERGKEIGIRKTMGATRLEIIRQFLIEAVLLSFFALLIAVPVIYLLLPIYTRLTGTAFTFAGSLDIAMLSLMGLFTLVAGMLSGLLPALFLSRYQPAIAVKGKVPQTKISRWARFGITVVQFTLSTSLIMMALATVLQIRFLNDMDLGFNKDNLVEFDSTWNIFDPDAFDFFTLVNELGRHTAVQAVGLSNLPLTYPGLAVEWHRPDQPPEQSVSVGSLNVNDEYVEALQLEVLAGRNFSRDNPADLRDFRIAAADAPTYSALVTRSTAQRFGFASPQDAIGEIILDRLDSPYRIIGVLEDFRPTGALDDPTASPGILRGSLSRLEYMFVRIDPNRVEEALAHIDAVWKQHRAGVPINRTFFSLTYENLIAVHIDGISKGATFASVITVLISAFGIYALAFYSGQRRTREVGIRKVLGATTSSIVVLLIWDLLKPVIIATLIAWDASDQMIDNYLEQFSSRVEISPLLFLALAFATLLLVVITSATQTFKTASTRPVESLRYE